MKIAVLERFATPSRRCDPARIAGPDDVVVVWDLSGEPGDPPSWSDVLRALPAWVTLRVPLRRRWRLLQICARMRGWRRTALVRVPGWAAQMSAGEIDGVACFSTRGFALAHWFAYEARRPCREMVTLGTQYFGEFAFEHVAVIPYAYWLHEQGRLKFTASTADTACLYYFSPDHTEVTVARDYVPVTEYPVGVLGDGSFDVAAFPAELDLEQWSPPPYRDVYADDGRFRWPKPPVVIMNKASSEEYLHRGFVVNALDTELLLALVRELTPHFTVIYNRPRASDIVKDHAEIREVGDIEAIKAAFADVISIQELHAAHPDLTFNELQLRVCATSERFVSVLGGASYLASYFGGTNVVFAQEGWEVTCGAFEHWFDRFSGARVVAVATPEDLLHAVRRELIRPVTA